MRSKADTSHAARNQQLKCGETVEKIKSKKTDMLRSIYKQSGESVEPVRKKKRQATVGRICRKRKVLRLEWKSSEG